MARGTGKPKKRGPPTTILTMVLKQHGKKERSEKDSQVDVEFNSVASYEENFTTPEVKTLKVPKNTNNEEGKPTQKL